MKEKEVLKIIRKLDHDIAEIIWDAVINKETKLVTLRNKVHMLCQNLGKKLLRSQLK